VRVVLLGATKGMGRSLARLFAERRDEVFLLGRDLENLQKSAQDLQVRKGSGDVGIAQCDLSQPDGFGSALDSAIEQLGGLDVVVVTAGMFATQEALEEDTALAHQLCTLNFANTVAFCEHARKRLLANGGGSLVVFSSVAGDRGRKPVAIYGASKAGLSHYLESLDHKFRAAGLVTLCVKPGFVKTSMTDGLKPPPFAGEPDQVAQRVLNAIDRKSAMVYAPFMWRWVMLVIRFLPRFIMRKVGF
jgi:decaprenylphospho-beta-D-erythro-pentofuranosid-2-ulose 2-reductase